MCGIYGLINKKTGRINTARSTAIIQKLAVLSESRGKEACGFLNIHDNKIEVFKAPMPVSQAVNQHQYKTMLRKMTAKKHQQVVFIGHARLATNGSYLDNKNNQPVKVGSFVGVHNGIIVNTEKIWKNLLHKKPTLQVDTEALLALLDKYYSEFGLEETIRKAFTHIEGSASVAIINIHEQILTLASNTGSLYYISDARNGYFSFASEKYILKKIFPNGKVQHVVAGTGVNIELNTLITKTFSLSKKDKFSKLAINEAVFQVLDYSKYPKIITSKDINPINKIQKHTVDYERIMAIKRCTKCILPETTPFISFDRKGVCNYCLQTTTINYLGVENLEREVAKYRSKDCSPDCIIGFSGGRDSSFGLHYLVKELGMHPIAYTYDWGMLSDIGRDNAARMTGSLGVEHIIVSANIAQKRSNIRKNILAWLKKPDLGLVPLFMAGDKQSEYYMNQLSKKTGIKLIIYCRGNQYEREEFKAGYCGIKNADPGGVIHHLPFTDKIKLATYYIKQFIRNPSYINSSLFDSLNAYICTYFIPHDYLYLWHYIPWDEEDIITTLKREYNWQTARDTIATWRIDDGSPAFYNYIYYHAQGFTEHDSLRSHQVRQGIISRERAMALAFDENKPRHEMLKWYFDQLDIDGDEALSIIDSIPTRY
jgi:glutamine---fructose-6-phosphate transaminase (isomerizing)